MKALNPPRLIGPEGTEVSVQFGGSPSAEIATTWRDPVTYTIGQSSPKFHDFVSGRFLAYRISSSSAQGVSLKSIDIEFGVHREALMYLVGNLSGVDPRLVAELRKIQEAMNSPVDGIVFNPLSASQRSRRTA